MVDAIKKTAWACPYCNDEYDTYDEAEECAKDCAPIDDPDEKTKTVYKCEYCKEQYDDCGEAEECEGDHERNHDRKYYDRLTAREQEKLAQAAAHKSQQKILGYDEATPDA